MLAPIGSDAGEVGLRGSAAPLLASGTHRAPSGQLMVHTWALHGRRERLGPPATFNKDTGAGYVSPKEGDYTRAQRRWVCARLVS